MTSGSGAAPSLCVTAGGYACRRADQRDPNDRRLRRNDIIAQSVGEVSASTSPAPAMPCRSNVGGSVYHPACLYTGYR
jgi:hypothetical protein